MPHSPTVFVYYGSDEGQSAAAAQDRYASLCDGSDGWGNELIEGTISTVDEAVSAINNTVSGLLMVNMFGGRKVIWLKAANFLGDSPQGMRSDAVIRALDSLLDALSHLPDDTYLIISASEMDKRRAFFKSLSKLAQMSESSKIDISKPGWEGELSALIMRLAKERSLRFEHAALDLFVHRVHESSRQIGNELDKLATYLGDQSRPLTVQDIELMVAVSRDGVVFEISRAIEQGNTAQAIKLIDAQLDRGEQAVAIIRAAIIPTMRSRFCAKLLMSEFSLKADNYRQFEASLASLPKQALKLVPLKKDGSPNAYSLFNAARSCGKQKLASLQSALKACAEADRALVSTGLESRQVLHQLVVRVTLA
ncbi:MAG: DNA polymerase III subunit delta [Akkermansia sp.]